MDPRRSAIVAWAAGQIGPGDIPAYWRSCGVAAPYPPAWCGAFALAALHAAGIAERVMWRIGLGFISPQKLPRTTTPQPGDILYLDKPFQHHGLVESFEGGVLTSIEGNTPTVQRKRRTDLRGLTFFSIAPLLGETAQPTTPAPRPPTPATPPPPPGAPGSGLLGIDVSHHQKPGTIDYAKLRATHHFVIARATYGTRRDETFVDHIRRAQAVGLFVGAYAFFRPDQDVTEQLAAFEQAAQAAGMGPGWICPSLDVEQNERFDGAISADRYAPTERICAEWRARWGDAMVYTNPSMWAAIGSPGWLREHHLWIAHYDVATPRTPLGLTWALWQHKVAPLLGIGGGPLDQNVARALPVLRAPTEPPALLPLEQDLDERRADRDDFIKDTDE